MESGCAVSGDGQEEANMGVGVGDYDGDGFLDLFLPHFSSDTPRVVYRNLGNGSFEEVSNLCGEPVLEPHSSRGCAFGDFNNDGSVEVLVLNMSEPPSLLLHQKHSGHHWLSIKLLGTRSNWSAIGARLAVTTGERRQVREVLSASSYISQSDLGHTLAWGRRKKSTRLKCAGRAGAWTG